MENDLTGRMVYMFFLGRNLVSGPLCTLKSKKNEKDKKTKNEKAKNLKKPKKNLKPKNVFKKLGFSSLTWYYWLSCRKYGPIFLRGLSHLRLKIIFRVSAGKKLLIEPDQIACYHLGLTETVYIVNNSVSFKIALPDSPYLIIMKKLVVVRTRSNNDTVL